MPYESLQAVVGTAVIDSGFRKALLNGSRQRVIQQFGLTNEETRAVMEIRADSLEQFAGQLDRWISQMQGHPEPPQLQIPSRILALSR
jgi:hypothetical protein